MTCATSSMRCFTSRTRGVSGDTCLSSAVRGPESGPSFVGGRATEFDSGSYWTARLVAYGSWPQGPGGLRWWSSTPTSHGASKGGITCHNEGCPDGRTNGATRIVWKIGRRASTAEPPGSVGQGEPVGPNRTRCHHFPWAGEKQRLPLRRCSMGGSVPWLAVRPTNAARRTMWFGVIDVGTKPMTSRRHHQENCCQVRRLLTYVLSC